MENKEGNMETINYISHTHNPKVVGSNPAPATNRVPRYAICVSRYFFAFIGLILALKLII